MVWGFRFWLPARHRVLGILHALMQNDVKRVLAYSTIEISALSLPGLDWRWRSTRMDGPPQVRWL